MQQQQQPMVLTPVTRGPGHDVELGLAWDFDQNKTRADLDCAAVMFDNMGVIRDACFYNKMSACNGAVRHSGDNKTGQGEGDDEFIGLDLDQLPQDIKVIVFVVSAYTEGHTFRHVKTAKAQLRDVVPGQGKRNLGDFQMACHGDHSSLILCALVRQDTVVQTVQGQRLMNQWGSIQLGVPCQGRNFQDCKEKMRECVDKFLDQGLICERVLSYETTFTMKKDDMAQLPPGANAMIIGLGWTCRKDLDFDASVIGLDANKNKVQLCSFSNIRQEGILHRGDNTSGAGSGDDERIRIEFGNVPQNTQELFVVINIYSNNATFRDVSAAYVRCAVARDGKGFEPGHVLAQYPLDGNVNARGLVFCRFIRRGGTWCMQALSWGCGGAMATDSACLDVVAGRTEPVAMTHTLVKGKKAAHVTTEDEGCCTIF